MDVLAPGAGLPPIERFGGVLRLGGALRAPLLTLDEDALDEYRAHEAWGDPYPHPFQTALATLVNLADDYGSRRRTPPMRAPRRSPRGRRGDSRPHWRRRTRTRCIVPPSTGAGTRHPPARPADAPGIPPEDEPWVHELNLDPRHRVAAGIGTQVVQPDQEDFMEAAWQQVGEVLEGNRKIRRAQVAKPVSTCGTARAGRAGGTRRPSTSWPWPLRSSAGSWRAA